MSPLRRSIEKKREIVPPARGFWEKVAVLIFSGEKKRRKKKKVKRKRGRTKLVNVS